MELLAVSVLSSIPHFWPGLIISSGFKVVIRIVPAAPERKVRSKLGPFSTFTSLTKNGSR